jgi:hypothetical protein
MNAKEFLEQEESTWVDVDENNLIKSCMIGFAERYHEYRVKNCSIPAVVGRSEQFTCSCGIPPAIRLCEGVETCLKCGERLSK